jgi:hypothetical protein
MMDNKPATILAAAAVVGLTILSYQHGKRIGQSESQQSRESSDGSSVVAPSLENGACSSDNHGEERAAGAAETKSTNGKSNAPDDDLDMLPIYPIGTLRSIYRLCVGTPRQVSFIVTSLILMHCPELEVPLNFKSFLLSGKW